MDNKKENTIELEDDSSSSNFFSPSSTPTKSTENISHIILLSVVWAAKTKSGVKTGYFDRRDSSDFIIKWIKFLIEIAGEVTKDSMYESPN
jgi:hypothetical protein